MRITSEQYQAIRAAVRRQMDDARYDWQEEMQANPNGEMCAFYRGRFEMLAACNEVLRIGDYIEIIKK